MTRLANSWGTNRIDKALVGDRGEWTRVEALLTSAPCPMACQPTKGTDAQRRALNPLAVVIAESITTEGIQCGASALIDNRGVSHA